MRRLIAVAVAVLLLLCTACRAEDERRERSVWDQIVDGWNSFWGGVASALGVVKDFLTDNLGRLWNATQSLARVMWDAGGAVAEAVQRGLGLFREFIGRWGDPELYLQITSARIANPYVEVRRVSDAALLVGRPELIGDGRSIDEVTPTGVLGFISFAVYAAESSMPLVQFVMQNFILIHIVVIVCLLAWGLVGAVEKRDADYLIESCERVIGIFKFYIRIIAWLVERLIAFIQMVAQWLDTIIPF